MKKFKKLTSVVAATLMAASMVAPAAFNTFAEDTTTPSNYIDFDMKNPTDKDISNVKAVPIFAVSGVTGETLNITDWSTNVKNADGLVAALKGIVGAKTTDDAATVATLITNDNVKAFAKKAADSLKNIPGFSATYSEGKVTFTDTLANGYYVITCTAGNLNASGEVEDAGKVYSLGMLTTVNGKTTIVGSEGKAKIGLPTVQKKVKEDVKFATERAKYETETTDEYKAWNDIADYDIGDSVPFKLYGTMPGNLGDYDHYYYEFSDTLDSQFTLNATIPEGKDINYVYKIQVGKKGTDDKYVYTPIHLEAVEGNLYKCQRKVGTGTDAKTLTTDVWIIQDGTSIRIIFEDVKVLDVNKDSVITVEYSATLNGTAKVGRPGQDNAVTLKYSNNPNTNYVPKNSVDDTGKPNADDNNKLDTPDSPSPSDKSETPEDRVRVFTYAIEIEKEFFAGDGSELTIAEIIDRFQEVEFNLKKGEGADATPVKFKKTNGSDSKFEYAVSNDADATADLKLFVVDKDNNVWTFNEAAKTLTNSEINEVLTAKKNSENKWYLAKEDDSEYEMKYGVTNADGTPVLDENGKQVKKDVFRMVIRAKGLDDGTYTLVETAYPQEYKKAPDQIITINATTTNTQTVNDFLDETGLTAFTYKIGTGTGAKDIPSLDDATAKTLVENRQGIEIPSTGGIGTKLFYLGGGAMVAIAGIFLITKKRMGKE